MKRKSIYSVLIGMLITVTSCEFLDQEVETLLREEQIIKYYNLAQNQSIGVYTALRSGLLEVDGAMMASASDEAEHTFEGSGIHKFNVGSWNASDIPGNPWDQYFQGIRRANILMLTADSVDLTPLTLNPTPDNQALYEIQSANIERWKHEARFLRAYYYFELIKRFGGVPLIDKRITLDDDYMSFQRNTLKECIDFILDDLEIAAEGLPVVYPDPELGRATQGAALALKSRVLLHAASELWNDPSWAAGYPYPELISLPPGDRVARWQAAADAAKEVIDLPGTGYTLANDYRGLFNTFNNPEIIFTRRLGASNAFERANFPIGYDRGESGTTPTQDMIDAYEMINGLPIDDPLSGYDPQNPYADRDPRLEQSIITNNSIFKERPVELWEGGRDGRGVPQASRTGYYLKKYVHEDLNLLIGATAAKSWHLIRLADVYLMYAEALNEASPGHPDIKLYVDMVRQRNGVNMPPIPDGLSQEEMRQRIRNERRVELAFEDHRLWDLRRWMQAVEYLNKPVRGMRITLTDHGMFDYSPFVFENRVFRPEMYFYPIPLSEMNIMTNWAQNPSWN
jgi:starch-binding outer membrane protein, SusD/RagB family